MFIKKDDKIIALEYLQKLVYGRSQKEYLDLYTDFCKNVKKVVLEYFDKNWHSNRNKWTKWGMSDSDLFNYSNNRLEGLNAKIKAVVIKSSSIITFFIHIVVFLKSQILQKNAAALKIFKSLENLLRQAAHLRNLKIFQLKKLSVMCNWN